MDAPISAASASRPASVARTRVISSSTATPNPRIFFFCTPPVMAPLFSTKSPSRVTILYLPISRRARSRVSTTTVAPKTTRKARSNAGSNSRRSTA